MSTFYLLPPRPLLGQRFGEFLTSLFPGLTWDPAVWTDLAEVLGAAAACYPDVFVIYREDLPEGDVEGNLAEAFGAEEGDEIVEVRTGAKVGDVSAHRWRLGQQSAASAGHVFPPGDCCHQACCGDRSPSRKAANREAVTMSAVVPGLRRFPSPHSHLSKSARMFAADAASGQPAATT
jgi:hypothetical protein